MKQPFRTILNFKGKKGMEVKVKKEDGDSREMRYLARKHNSEQASKHKAAESM